MHTGWFPLAPFVAKHLAPSADRNGRAQCVTLRVAERDDLGLRFKLIAGYDANLVAFCKFIDGRTYEAADKSWSFPLPAYTYVAAYLRTELCPAINADFDDLLVAAKSAYEAKAVDWSRVPEPLRSVLLPFQRDGVEYVVRRDGRALIGDEMGLGKGGRPSDSVLTPSGWRRYDALALGDNVIGSSGAPVAVTGIFHRGVLDLFRVVFHDGGAVVVDGDHLWALVGPAPSVVSTRELAAAVTAGCDLAIPVLSGPAQFTPSTARSPRDLARALLDEASPSRRTSHAALFASVETRTAVLGALGLAGSGASMATLPTAAGARAAADIALSLGRLAGIHPPIKPDSCWHVWVAPATCRARPVARVERCGSGPTICIRVSAPDALYVTEAFAVTHNTLQGIAVASYYSAEWPALVIVPPSLKDVWAEALIKWHPHLNEFNVTVVRKRGDSLGSSSNGVTVMSYDAVRHKIDEMAVAAPRVVVLDESQYIKNASAQRTRLLLPYLTRTASRVILLSGTPALSRPRELFTQIAAVAPRLFPSYDAFAQRYCGGVPNAWGQYNGASHLAELAQVLGVHVLVRRVKKEVLAELPAKRRQLVHIVPAQQQLASLLRARDGLNASSSATNREERDEAMTLFYTATAMAKIKPVSRFVADLVRGNVKFLVFAHHALMLDALAETISSLGARYIRIDASVDADKRLPLVKLFQTDQNIQVALLSLTAASAGLTLTAASHVVFAELHWTPGMLLQAEDRVHRIGQKSLDVSMWSSLVAKLYNLSKLGLADDELSFSSSALPPGSAPAPARARVAPSEAIATADTPATAVRKLKRTRKKAKTRRIGDVSAARLPPARCARARSPTRLFAEDFELSSDTDDGPPPPAKPALDAVRAMSNHNPALLDDEFYQHLRSLEAVYVQRQSAVQGECERLRQHAESVESELAAARRRIRELEVAFEEALNENQALVDSRNAAMDKYNQLRGATMHLEQFKAAITNMVADSAVAPQASQHAPRAPPAAAAAASAGSLHNASADHLPPRPYPAGAGSSFMSGSYAPHSAASPMQPSPYGQQAHSSPSPARQDEEEIDAAAFYRKVKAAVSPEEFKTFAANIRRLNKGEQSIEDTLDSMRGVLRDPELFAQLHTLIRQAVLAAAREASSVGVSQISMDSSRIS
ncbi:SWF/SNF family helicase [Thecamonas trahens ATCC 50062]|uniref:SWF/SNF family helicase n=1 Tax=Thecamonas trahens ATCC 50062 TaxID=461836 RepID=A0A0L0DLN7_THETB|nr:SWF/SNF family helicase [Thecamonas trahens ATCC 50062]KNC53160.1 SWF/SNF family helicase [Thecamonas trahens ATCC 50062]|eukprot:XP_013754633.1 SWF/SNF family helicase [Thecamonas trahens ATCC 50062]